MISHATLNFKLINKGFWDWKKKLKMTKRGENEKEEEIKSVEIIANSCEKNLVEKREKRELKN